MDVIRPHYRVRRPVRGVRKRRKLPVIIFLLFVVLSGVYVSLALSKDIADISPVALELTEYVPEQINLPWPNVGQAAIGNNGVVLAQSSTTELQKPIASITKLITALAVLEKSPLQLNEQGKSYSIGAQDIESYQSYVSVYGSVMSVNLGQQLTQYQVLQGLLLPSANNIADSVARWEFGSMEAYITYANAMLAKMGLSNTYVGDASGFSPKSVSTPSDLILLGQKVLAHPVLRQIAVQREAFVPGTGVIRNTNQLLADEGVIGLKTGTTDEAGSCLLFAVSHGPDKESVAIGVVMGQPNWPTTYRVVRDLRDAALSKFQEIEFVPAGTILGSYKTDWGTEVDAVSMANLRSYGWTGSRYDYEVELINVSVNTKEQFVVGSIGFAEGGKESEVVLKQDIKSPSIWWRLTNYW